MRTRTKSVPPTYQNGQEGGYRPSTGSWSGTPSNVSVKLTFDESSMRDWPTKQFKKLQGEGRLIVTSMIQDRTAATVIPSSNYKVFNPVANTGYQRVNQWGSEMLGFGVRVGDSNMVSDEAHRLRTLAITECFASVAEPDVETLVSVAEARETLEFLRNPFEKALKLTRRWRRWTDMKQRDLVNHQNALDRWSRRRQKGPPPVLRNRGAFVVGKVSGHDIPSAWLAYRYGLMPLVYDIQGVMKAFDRKLGRIVRQTYRARRESTGSVLYTVTSGPYSWSDIYEYNTTATWSVVVRAGCVAEYEATRAQTLGLHWSYLPSAAWEVVTLSFVADWFLNIGDYLKAISVSARADIKTAWAVTETTWNLMTEMSGRCTTAPNVMQYDKAPVCSYVNSRKSRDPISGASVGVTRQFAMNTKRYIDAAALLSNLLKRK